MRYYYLEARCEQSMKRLCLEDRGIILSALVSCRTNLEHPSASLLFPQNRFDLRNSLDFGVIHHFFKS